MSSPAPASAFLYDFNSPYAYLAATRVDDVIPGGVRWQPVAFAFLLRARGRTPWSLDQQQRPAGMADCEARARAYGLEELRWPPGWPVASYSLAPLRAAVLAADHGLLRAFSIAAFRRNFVDGLGLAALSDVLSVAEQVGLDRDAVEVAVDSPEIKDRLTASTQAAIDRSVVGVPTVVVDNQLFWGDDQLETAAAAVSRAS